ncbi:MAG: GNAT family N-acetyltransferase [Candidatus Liptonbacteria bacterium]|nr:GNAT family N-acetyltransferase [Candidatus Liptonbacteria bacterium]
MRNCEPKDIPRVIQLLKDVKLFWEIGDKEDVCLKKLQHDPDSILVLEEDGKIIGTAFTVYDPWASFLWHLSIAPECQGRGLASLLSREAERRLKARGTTSVNGYVAPDNSRSLSFLKKHGYDTSSKPVIPVEKVLE